MATGVHFKHQSLEDPSLKLLLWPFTPPARDRLQCMRSKTGCVEGQGTTL